MYLLSEFLEEDFLGVKFPSDDYKVVAENALLGNPAINTKDELERCAKIISEIPANEIRTVTFSDLQKLGIPLI